MFNSVMKGEIENHIFICIIWFSHLMQIRYHMCPYTKSCGPFTLSQNYINMFKEKSRCLSKDQNYTQVVFLVKGRQKLKIVGRKPLFLHILISILFKSRERIGPFHSGLILVGTPFLPPGHFLDRQRCGNSPHFGCKVFIRFGRVFARTASSPFGFVFTQDFLFGLLLTISSRSLLWLVCDLFVHLVFLRFWCPPPLGRLLPGFGSLLGPRNESYF